MFYFAPEAVATLNASWWHMRLVNWFGDHFLSTDADGQTVYFCRYRGVVYYMGRDTEDTPLVTFDQVVGWMRNALAGLGVLALAVGMWLWQAGFFQGAW